MGFDWEEILGDGDLAELYNDLIPLPDELDELEEPYFTEQVRKYPFPLPISESDEKCDSFPESDDPFPITDFEESLNEDDDDTLPFDD